MLESVVFRFAGLFHLPTMDAEVMKTRFLSTVAPAIALTAALTVVLMMGSLGTASAQSFRIDWKDPDTVRGDGTKIIKRLGTVVNETDTEKRLRIRYDLTNVNFDHFVQICMTECFAMFPGGEDDAIRNDQVVAPNGSQEIYVDSDAQGVMGTSTVSIDLYEKSNPSDMISFDVTFVFDNTTSVIEASDRGITASPLPASDILHLQGNLEGLRSVDLYSSDGVLLRTFPAGSAMNVSGLASGTYHLLLHTTQGELLRMPITVVR